MQINISNYVFITLYKRNEETNLKYTLHDMDQDDCIVHFMNIYCKDPKYDYRISKTQDYDPVDHSFNAHYHITAGYKNCEIKYDNKEFENAKS